jgi:hypothetical protein
VFRQVVDLAALFSATVLREEGGGVRAQYDSRDQSAFAFAARIARTALDPECEATFIEDVPKNPRYTQVMTKPVFKLQGIIMAFGNQSLDRVFMVNPSTWMTKFPGVQRVPADIAARMTTTQKDRWREAKAAEYARELGYEAPDLISDWQAKNPTLKPLKKYTNVLDKNRTDYVSAFLMSEYLRDFQLSEFPFQGVEPAHI